MVQKYKLLIKHFQPYKYKFASFIFCLHRELHKLTLYKKSPITAHQYIPQHLQYWRTHFYKGKQITTSSTATTYWVFLEQIKIGLLEKPVHCPHASSTCIQTEPLWFYLTFSKRSHLLDALRSCLLQNFF